MVDTYGKLLLRIVTINHCTYNLVASDDGASTLSSLYYYTHKSEKILEFDDKNEPICAFTYPVDDGLRGGLHGPNPSKLAAMQAILQERVTQ